MYFIILLKINLLLTVDDYDFHITTLLSLCKLIYLFNYSRIAPIINFYLFVVLMGCVSCMGCREY